MRRVVQAGDGDQEIAENSGAGSRLLRPAPRPRATSLLIATSMLVAACSADPAPSDDGTWVGTITTEGNVTTVVNESGSVWGGTATLVEEASIGVDVGADEYMLGEVAGVAATGDKIFVVDSQVPALRVYDHQGRHLYDIGAPGQGPGEYQEPSSVAIASDRRVFLRDARARRIWIYTEPGEYVGAFEMAGGLRGPIPLVLSINDVPYSPMIAKMLPDDPNRVWVIGMQAHGEDGPLGEPLTAPIDESFVPGIASDETGSVTQPVPFFPQEKWALTPGLDIIFGVSSSYRFEVRRADGSLLEVERTGEPVPVDPAEADWNKRRVIATMRLLLPGWAWGDAPEIPQNKPAYDEFIPTHSGAIWVLRPGPGIPLPGCDDEAETFDEFAAFPCWRDRRVIDIFGPDGRILGAVNPPPEMRFSPRPYIDGDLVITRADEGGTIMVKRYRLVLPGEEERRPNP